MLTEVVPFAETAKPGRDTNVGEKETASAEEAELLKTKTKSNQSNDRSAQEAGNVPGDEAELVKTKTKSNQSNDRLDQGDDGGASAEGPEGAESKWYNVKTNEKGRLAAKGGPGGDETGVAAGDLDGDGAAEAAINNSESNLKSGPRQTLDVAGGGSSASDASLRAPGAGYDIKSNTK